MGCKVVSIKLISRLRPSYLAGPHPPIKPHFDGVLGVDIISLDLAHIFWNIQFSKLPLANYLRDEPVNDDPSKSLSHELDHLAVSRLTQAKQTVASVDNLLPSASALFVAFRVLSRCAGIATRRMSGLQVHLARGVVPLDFDQWDLDTVLNKALGSSSCALQRHLYELIDENALEGASVVVLSLRNDGELSQALMVGRRVKELNSRATVILDASGANEQFSFASWVPLLVSANERVSQCLDYFLPQEDYKATLARLIDALLRQEQPMSLPNAIRFGQSAVNSPTSSCVNVSDINDAFRHHREHQDCFPAGGDRAFVTRLSPGKCHWSACAFCTINSQHLLPRASASVNFETNELIKQLLKIVRVKRVRHLILMDEALPPPVLFALADAIQREGLSIVYRVRCRFSDDFTDAQCKILFDSGCRFLGLGLESASNRVNKFINKHLGSPPDYMRVISSLSNAGIRPHIYSIMGFPTETPEETHKTRDFLIDAIRQHPYVTVSANTFHLMRGSGIYAEPERFGISEMQAEGNVSLVLRFNEAIRDANLHLPHLAAREVFRSQYLPDVDDAESAEAFWYFIDQTGIFYLQKVLLDRNPYHDLAASRRVPSDFLDRHYSFEALALLKSYRKDDSVAVLSWITQNYVWIPESTVAFVTRSRESRSVRENLTDLLPSHLISIGTKVARSLIAAGILIPVELDPNPFVSNMQLGLGLPVEV